MNCDLWSQTPSNMIVSARMLRFLGFLAWGIAWFGTAIPSALKHAAISDLYACQLYSAESSSYDQTIGWITLLGAAVGFVLSGIAGDRFGRFRVLIGSLAGVAIFSGLSGLAFRCDDFLLLRFFTGAASGGVLLSSSVLLFEAVDGKSRAASLLFLPLGGMFGAAASAGFWAANDLFSFIPFAGWRTFFLLQTASIFFVPFFYRRHDEPIRWKRSVRDSSMSPHWYDSLSEAVKPGRRRRLAFVFVLALAGIAGFRGLALRGTEHIRELAGERAVKSSGVETMNAAIFAWLFRHPPLLNMKDIETTGISTWPGIARHVTVDDDRSACLAEAMLKLHENQKTIDAKSLVDQGLERWNAHHRPDRAAPDVPLEEAELFERYFDAWLERGDRVLASLHLAPSDEPPMTGAETWSARMEVLKTLMAGLNERTKRHCLQVDLHEEVFRTLFFLSGIASLGMVARIWLRRRSRMFFGHFTALTFMAAAFWLFGLNHGSPISICIGSVLFGIPVFSLLVGCVATMPAIFRTSCRCTACGLCMAAACAVSLLVFQAIPEAWYGAMIPLCFALGILGCCRRKTSYPPHPRPLTPSS